jgi:DUF1680 family protein
MRRLLSALGAAVTLAAVAWIGTGDSVVAGQRAARLDRDYPVQPVSFEAVHLNDAFWAPKIETNRQASIQAAFEQCEASGRVDNFIRAAQVLRGETPASLRAPGYPFDDTDLYKVIEGASYTLAVRPDPALEERVNGYIRQIAAAQEKDGYLYTTRTINPAAPHRWAGKERWELEKVDSHELYNFGHLAEAAVAHYQATGKKTLLDVATRFADLLVDTFGPGKRAIWPGHQITEMALVRLYRVTGKAAYLDLSKFMLDVRKPDAPASSNHPATYNQSQVPVIEQTEAVGHAVRATYMYSGMADVAALTGDKAYVKALEAIWNDITRAKLYITGGIGASGSGEAFGRPYQLPNMTAYNETCASVGNDFWNHRMFLLTGDAKYVDVMERTLFNGLISGVSLDGKTFFYPNPLESRGQHARSAWFGVACCPGNITRFMASVPGYMYAQKDQDLFVNLYAAGTADVTLKDGLKIKLTQDTRYPWDGVVRLKVNVVRSNAPPTGNDTLRANTASFAMNLRVPGWARNEVVPGDLYRFLDPIKETATVKINSQPFPTAEVFRMAPAAARARQVSPTGYFRLDYTFRDGDVVELTLPMVPRRVVSHAAVEANVDRVAIQRGPIVYAAEWPDNNGHVRNVMLPDSVPLKAEHRGTFLHGVTVVTSTATWLERDEKGGVVKKTGPFTAIPYYAWANRGRGEMLVWLPRTEKSATPSPFPTLAMLSKVTNSGKASRSPSMINDGEDPRNSSDSSAYFDWWPLKSSNESVEMIFPKSSTVSEIQVYWFDDTGRGEVRVPATWRLLYKDGDTWKPVEATSPYGVAVNQYNVVSFKPVTTGALKIELTMQQTWSAGLQEWKVK